MGRGSVLYIKNLTGACFVTICTQNRRCILSDILVGDGVLDVPQVRLTNCGKAAEETLQEINHTYDHISIEKYVFASYPSC